MVAWIRVLSIYIVKAQFSVLGSRVLSISSRRSQTLSHFVAQACRSQNEFEVKDNQHPAELHKA